MKDTVASKSSMTSDIAQLTVSKVVVMMISLITAMLLSRFRTLEEFGTYSQIMLITNLFTTLFILGLPNSLNYFLAKAESEEDKQCFLSNYYTLSLIISVGIGLILFSLSPFWIAYFKNPKISNYLYFFLLLPWALITLASIDAFLIIYKRVGTLLLFRILNAFFLLAIVILTQLLSWTFNTYMLSFMIIKFCFAFCVYIVLKRLATHARFFLKKKLIKEIFTFSIPIGLATVSGVLKKECDKLIIAKFYDTAALAVYANAARELPVMFLTTSMTAVIMPRMVRKLHNGEKKSVLELWGHATLFSYICISFLSTLFFVYAPEFMSFFYSEKYITGASVFRAYALVLIFRSTYFGIILNSIGKTRAILYSSLFAMVINIILNIAFYYLWGFTGPAYATLTSTFFSAWYLLYETSKNINVPIKELFPWRKILHVSVLNVLLGVIFFFLKDVLSWEKNWGQIGESFSLGAIWGLVYFVCTYKAMRTQWISLNQN